MALFSFEKRIGHIRPAARILAAVFFVLAFMSMNQTAFALSDSDIKRDQENSGEWTMPTGSDVVLKRWKTKITDATITTSSHFDVQINKDNYRVNMEGMEKAHDNNTTDLGKGKSIRYNKSVSAGYDSRTYGSNGKVTSDDLKDAYITLFFSDAAEDLDGNKYDIEIKMTDIHVRMKSGSGTASKGVALVYGDNTINYGLHFGAVEYKNDGGESFGAKFAISVKLYKNGTKTAIDGNKKMVWGFDDIDIKDKISSGDLYRDGNYWAENVKLVSGFYAPIHLAKDSELDIFFENNNTTVRFAHNNNSANNNKQTSIMFLINPQEFVYTWGGSGCATDFTVPAGTLFTGSTAISVDGTSRNPNSDLTVSGQNHTVSFTHTIFRNDYNYGDKTDKYYLNSGTDNTWQTIVSTTSITNFKSRTTRGAPDGSKSIAASLSPGDSKKYWQTLHYQRSNISTSYSVIHGVSCTVGGGSVNGRHCVRLTRPEAKFTGSVAAKVKLDGTNFVNPVNETTTPEGNKVTTNNGSYAIRFTNTIARQADGSGGSVITYWYSTMRVGSTGGAAISGKRKPASGSGSVTLAENGSSAVIKESDGYTYTGTLKYGETKIICDVLTYNDIRSTALTNGGHSADAHKCVKIYRDPKPCDLDESYKYSINSGENLGRVGVRNYSRSSSYTYTPTDPSAFTSTNGYTKSVTVYARPGDSIKFIHNGCAGGQYAVNNSNLDATTYKTTYSISGSLKQYNQSNQLTTIKDQDYLFGEKIPTVRQTSPLKYNGSITLNSTDTGTGFPVGNNVEYAKISPSKSEETTYSRDIYNNKTYSCDNLNPNVSFAGNHYQITGRSSATNDNCHAYSKTGVASDVGKIITQTMSWNHLKVSSGSPNTAYARKFTAEANVAIPYNYNAQPYAGNTAIGNVVYRGSSMSVNLKVFVTPRKNTAFGEGDTANDKKVNTYATITKPTKVTARYFYRKSSDNTEFGAKDVTDLTYNGVLNKNGAFYGNASDSTTLANGGSTVGSVDVPVPDSLTIGDKVCVQLTVTPADSHNSFMAATVNGAGSNNAALMEKGASSKTAEFCRTVAKLPTISVEGSNAYTGNSDKGFITSRYAKRFSDTDATKYVFGSWSEYGVYGKVTVDGNHGFASGATFGYQTGNSGGLTVNQTRDNSGGVSTGSTARSSTCTYSTQTFVNSQCSANIVGSTTIGDTAAKQFRQRIEERFTSGSSPWIQPSAYNTDCVASNYNHTHKCISAKGDYPTTHAFADYDVFMNNMKDENGDPIRDENGMIHVRINGDAYFGAATTNTNYRTDMVMNHNFWSDESTFNWTYVYEISGTFVLDGDIKVGDIRDGGNNYKDNPILERLGNIRVPIISVDKLYLTNNVTRIDAIIFANEINTCAFNNYSDFLSGNKINVGGNILDSTKCNNAIEFRAPVYTKKLILNRTAGGESGASTIQRAEIFNMNMATYLWSFNQMSRYSQAVTVGQKEQPPRY